MAIFHGQTAARGGGPERLFKGPVIGVIGASFIDSRLSDPIHSTRHRAEIWAHIVAQQRTAPHPPGVGWDRIGVKYY